MVEGWVRSSDGIPNQFDATPYFEQASALEIAAFIDSDGHDFNIALYMAEKIMNTDVVSIFDYVSRFNSNHATGHIFVECFVDPAKVKLWSQQKS